MKIRGRMAWSALAITAPQVLALVWWDGGSRREAAEVVLASLLDRVVDAPGAQAACAADPIGWTAAQNRAMPGPGDRRDGPGDRPDRPPDDDGPPADLPPRGGLRAAPPRVYPYAASGVSAVPDAPPLDLTDGVAGVAGPWSSAVVVSARTGWGGDCDVIAVHGTTVPGFLGARLPASPLWVAPLVLVITVMLLAAGPTVRRLDTLTRRVRDGARPVAIPGDDEIAELSLAFDAATDALQREVDARVDREQALRDFVAHTAHDVRIPLTVLRGHLAALEAGPDPEALRLAASEAHYLGVLVDNLATHARLATDLPRHRVDLGEVVQRVAARHAPIARRGEVHLAFGVPEGPVWVLADLGMAEQALSNLVYNAIRYNRPGGHVAITLDVDAEGFRLVVLDDGPGAAPDELARLTERGFRGSASRGRDGQGLGLHIVADVARRFDWTFRLTPGEEGGLHGELIGRID